jgi:AcrR family transcriptional regulator
MNDILEYRECTHQVIADAAYSLFVEQGFHATSIRQIAQRVGVSLGAIYNHFDNKDQIFDKVLLEKHPYH